MTVVVLLMGSLHPVASNMFSAPRPEVLVYIVNETAPTASDRARIEMIMGWLQRSSVDTDHAIAESLSEDLATFPIDVDRAVASLKRHQDHLDGAVIATNRLLQSGFVLVRRAGEHAFERAPFALRPLAHPLAASSPLAQLDNIESVLDVAAKEFDPQVFRYVLVTVSHGDAQFALTPRVGRRLDLLNEHDLLEQVHAAVPVHADERFGITATELLDAIERRHDQEGLDFSLVVLHTCHAHVDRVPEGVARVLFAAGDGSIRRDAINYEVVLAHTAPDQPLSRAFVAVLVPQTFLSVGRDAP